MPLEPPLKQFKSGIPLDEIDCKKGFVIVVKNSNWNPVCVKAETKQKLIEREWGESSEFYGLTKFQKEIIQQSKFTCAKVGDSEKCKQGLEKRKNFFREQNLSEPSNTYHAEIIGLEDHYSEKEQIIFSTYLRVEGNDCVTWVHSVQGPVKEDKKIDEMIVRTNCHHDPNADVYEYEDDFKFNTPEKIRVFESGKYKFVISANYFKETKILAEKEFTIN